MQSKKSEVGMMSKKTVGKRSQTTKKKGSRKAVTPSPIPDVSSTWRPGDVVEIFDKISWKIAVLSQILGKNCFLVRPVGSSSEFKVTKVNIRERSSWKCTACDANGKDCRSFDDGNCNTSVNVKYDRKQRSAQKSTNLRSNDADNVTCSVGSCSINEFPPRSSRDRAENSNGDLSYAESIFRIEEKENLDVPAKEELEAEIHRLELHAYRCTMEALHASGPLSWEKEELVTNLRLSLHISNDEHLKEIRTLISANTCITSR